MFNAGPTVRRSLRRRRTLESMFSDEEGEEQNEGGGGSASLSTLSDATRTAMGLPLEGTLRCVCGAGSSSNGPTATAVTVQSPTTVSVDKQQSKLAATSVSLVGGGASTDTPPLVECAICFFSCHKKCVNVSGWSHVALRAFLCPFCAGGAFKRPRERAQMLMEAGHSGDISAGPTGSIDLAAASTTHATAKVKINEVKDRDPTPVSTKPLIQQTLQALIDSCATIKTPSPAPPPQTTARPTKGVSKKKGAGKQQKAVISVDSSDDSDSDGGYDLIFVPPLHSESYLPNIPVTDSDDDADLPSKATTGRKIETTTSTKTTNNGTGASSSPPSSPSVVTTGGGGTRRSIFKRSRNAEEAAALLPEPPSMSASSPHHRPSTNPTDSLSPINVHTSANGNSSGSNSSSGRMASVLTDSRINESIECCQTAIANATFSDSYPQYILNELQQLPHQYLQGTFAVDRRSKKVVSLVITNGMDVYGNLKPTLSLLRSAMTRWGASDVQPPPLDKPEKKTTTAAAKKAAASAAANNSSDGPPSPQLIPENLRKKLPSDAFMFNGIVIQPFMQRLVKEVDDVSGFVHFNLIATHTEHRGRGLAKRLMLAESLRWLLRGRTQSYLNMALERVRVTPSGKYVPYVATPTPPPAPAPQTPSSPTGRNGSLASKTNKNNNSKVAEEKEEEEEGDVVCIFSEASRRLYIAMGFRDVYPRFDPQTGDAKWTTKEEEGGRVMANIDMKESSRIVAAELIGQDVPLVSGRRVLRLKSRK